MNCITIRNVSDVKYAKEHYNVYAGTGVEIVFEECESPSELPLTMYNVADIVRRCAIKATLDIPIELCGDTTLANLFAGCDMLSEVVFTDKFDTSFIVGMECMFSNCEALKSVSFGAKFDTKSVRSMRCMFFGCRALETIRAAANFDTSCVEDMSYMFESCLSLKTIDVVQHFDTKSCAFFSSMFAGCRSLESIDVSHFDTSSAIDMSKMFSQCYQLKAIDVTHFDTKNVKIFDSMFYMCEALTLLDVTHFDTKNATNLYGMFAGCKCLNSIDVSHFDTSKATNLSHMFESCINLTSIDVSNFDTNKAYAVEGMFSRCISAKSIVFGPNFTIKYVQSISSMFMSCHHIQSIDISMFDPIELKIMYGTFEDCVSLETINMGSIDLSHANTLCHAFRYCPKLKNVIASSEIYVDDEGMYESMLFDTPNLDLSFINFTNYTGSIRNIVK